MRGHDAGMNRERRRHPEQKRDEQKLDPQHGPEQEMLGHDRPQDEFSVRAKNSGHKKKTADKWNQ